MTRGIILLWVLPNILDSHYQRYYYYNILHSIIVLLFMECIWEGNNLIWLCFVGQCGTKYLLENMSFTAERVFKKLLPSCENKNIIPLTLLSLFRDLSRHEFRQFILQKHTNSLIMRKVHKDVKQMEEQRKSEMNLYSRTFATKLQKWKLSDLFVCLVVPVFVEIEISICSPSHAL